MTLDSGFIIIYISVSSPEFLKIMYESIVGKIVMTICLILYLLAYIWGRKNCGQHYGGIGEMTKFIIVVFLVLSAFIVFTIPYRHRYKRKLVRKT